MELLEKDIEGIIYESPWLLDERFDVPNIKGTVNRMPGRQVKIGANGVNRYIDLLFRDTRDNRPVIIELKKGDLIRENIAQILEYRALVVSMDEESRLEWLDVFGKNYYCPKLILIGTKASEETRISANLAGIEIRTLQEDEKVAVDFTEISQITKRINEWNNFRKSGNRLPEDRDIWLREIFELIKDVVNDYDNDEVTTVKKLYEMTDKNAWITGYVFPFINIPIFYNDEDLCGLYEFWDDKLGFSAEYVYFDFRIRKIYDSEDVDKETINQIESKAKEILKGRGYNIIRFEQSCATIQFERSLLENVGQFKKRLAKLITDAIYVNAEIDKLELA